jgi:simple sugar transport system permease protein
LSAYPTLVALLIAFLCGSLLILAYGASPLEVWAGLLRGTLGNFYGIGEVLYKATPLVFTGLAVAIGFEAGLFNTGAEGQLMLGGFCAALIGRGLGGTSSFVALCLMASVAMACGALLGLLPGVLKAATGAHEVISTIMLNAIVGAVLLWAGGRWFFQREQVHTAPIADGAQLSPLSRWLGILHGAKVSTGFFLALAACVLVAILLRWSVLGLRLAAVGKSPRAAETAGLSVGRMQIVAMCLSGALCGLGGYVQVASYPHYYETGFSGGVGFLGIAVALLGRNRPAGILGAALFLGLLEQGGFAVSALVPREVVMVLQAVLILAVAATSPATRALLAQSLTPARPNVVPESKERAA